MSIIHFLNVRNGDCSIIEHTSGRVSVIDICNGNDTTEPSAKANIAENASLASWEDLSEAIIGNFRQKAHPDDPISYIKGVLCKTGQSEIFRFILTHPDMDHMDGFKRLLNDVGFINFWDTDNNKENKNFGNTKSYNKSYNKADWDAYQNRRKIDEEGARTLYIYDGATGKYFNCDENGGNGDYLQVLCPTEELIKQANANKKDYNDASYVILYNEFGKKILFPGDSGGKEWNILLANHRDDLTDIDVLIAPHHGRKSGGNDEFLKVLRPKLTLFGNAKSKDLNYSDWYDLPHYTNNQGGNFILDVKEEGIDVYCSNGVFAKSENGDTSFNNQLDAWFLRTIAEAI